MAENSYRDWELLSMSASIDRPAGEQLQGKAEPESSGDGGGAGGGGGGGSSGEDETKKKKEKKLRGWSALVSRARQTNPLLSLAIAAVAVVGLVILGRRLHQERCENRLLRAQIPKVRVRRRPLMRDF